MKPKHDTDLSHLPLHSITAEGIDNLSLQNPDSVQKPPRLEGYEFKELLGSGGNGSVWRATQISTAGRDVAVKILRGSISSSHRARLRFEREVQVLASLEHPGIARLYHYGDLTGGFPYLVMEFIDGVSLIEYVERESLGIDEIARLFIKICEAVAYAHRRGIIHRDLKPGNILVSEDGQPHVVDFGLGKEIRDKTLDITVTAEHGVVGTLPYMSPEQARGQNDDLDTRSDVFSIGVTLYQLIAGQLPYEIADTEFDLQRSIVDGNVKSPRSIKKGIPIDLEAIVMKALSKEAEKRYESAGELAEDLHRFLKREPVSARRLTTIYYLKSLLRRHKMRAFIVITIITCMILGVGYSYIEIATSRAEAVAASAEWKRQVYFSRIQNAANAIDRENVAEAMHHLALCPETHRNWEWHYLWLKADQSLWSVETEQLIRDVAFNSNERTITAILRNGNTLRWHVGNDHPQTLGTYGSDSSRFSLSKDGHRLLVLEDKTIHVVNLKSGASERTHQMPEEIRWFAATPDLTWISVVHHSNRISIFSETDHKPVDLVALNSPPNNLYSFTTTSTATAWASGDSIFIQRHHDSLSESIETYPIHGEEIKSLDCDPTETFIYAITYSGKIFMLNLSDVPDEFSGVSKLASHASQGSRNFTVGAKSGLFFVANQNGSIHLLERNSPETKDIFRGHRETVRMIRYDQDTGEMITASDRNIRFWVTGQTARPFFTTPVNNLFYFDIEESTESADAFNIMLPSQQFASIPRSYDIGLKGHHYEIRDSPYALSSSSSNGGFYLSDPQTGDKILEVEQSVSRSRSAFSNWVWWVENDDAGENSLCIWNVKTQQPLPRIKTTRIDIRKVEVDPSENRMAILGVDGTIEIYQTKSPKQTPLRIEQPDGVQINDLSFNENGSRLLACGVNLERQGRITMYDSKTGNQVLDLSPPNSETTFGVSFDRAGRTILASSPKATYRWSTDTPHIKPKP